MTDDERLRAIADEHGTPVYVYDLDRIGERAGTLRAALPDRAVSVSKRAG